jgi:NO-binding membrane sensor protein with MHYT domain
MSSWFLDGSRDPATALASAYDPILVAASIVVACLATYAGLSIAERIADTEKTIAKTWWLSGGAFTMGTGVWTMHFIAMLAFKLPVPVRYDFPITLLSTFPAILASSLMCRSSAAACWNRGDCSWAESAWVVGSARCTTWAWRRCAWMR